MVGLNYEMARQLLWNDYPTDQRGSYFRQFWDVSAYVPQPSDPTDPAALAELLKDIPPIHTWPHADLARARIPTAPTSSPNNVVLLVRGELFKRYPTPSSTPARRSSTVKAARARRHRRALSDFPRHAAQRHHLPRLQSQPWTTRRAEPRNRRTASSSSSSSSRPSRASAWSRWRTAIRSPIGPIWHGRTSAAGGRAAVPAARSRAHHARADHQAGPVAAGLAGLWAGGERSLGAGFSVARPGCRRAWPLRPMPKIPTIRQQVGRQQRADRLHPAAPAVPHFDSRGLMLPAS